MEIEILGISMIQHSYTDNILAAGMLMYQSTEEMKLAPNGTSPYVLHHISVPY